MAIPFSYSGGDEILHGTLTKGVMDNGWYLHNRYLRMPAGLNLYDFPVGDNFHLIWMKLI
jgi:phosphoglycerol transferase